ncbi:MAG: L-aspartate oxidase [Actinobacteria bacterium]|nr:L-aspartate oxidase [Actinomycetota bacterium]
MFPRYIINPSFARRINEWCDCIVIGSGIAGLSTAIRVSGFTRVMVLTKSRLSESTTWYAQGGIAAAIKKPDWWKVHYRDTIEAGQGLCDTVAVEKLVKNAPRMIEDLLEMGISFDISGGEISLTTEGGHSYPRVLHAGGDATGEEIENKLVKHSKTFSNIEFHPEHLALDVLTGDDGRVLGVISLNLENSSLEIYPSDSVVIASGGIGHLYEVSTNPSISTGDGIAMSWRAGASLKDIEFIQFHPTVFKTNDGHLFLITEALRGEGAYLRDSNGKRFMAGRHPKAELAPRDIVVKEMVKVMAQQNMNFIFLDATHIPEKLLKVRFPNIISKLMENGLKLSTDLIKVFPAAHYLNGGIRTDLKGKTDIGGLYACGETAATGAHGANRLASNSLIEGLVFGWEISKDIIKKLENKKSSSKIRSLGDLEKLLSCCRKNIQEDVTGIKDNYRGQNNVQSSAMKLKHLDAKTAALLEETTAEFRHMMSKNVGILRDSRGISASENFIKSALKKTEIFNIADKIAIELANMLNVGYLVGRAAGIRCESRGTHQRSDFTEQDDVIWKKHIILKKDTVNFEPVN